MTDANQTDPASQETPRQDTPRQETNLTDDQLRLIEYTYANQGGLCPSVDIAYQALLGPRADRFAQVPRDCLDFRICLDLLVEIPAARAALPQLAARSPHWYVLVKHWDQLVAILHEETAGRMKFPWADRTTRALKHLAHEATLHQLQGDIDSITLPGEPPPIPDADQDRRSE